VLPVFDRTGGRMALLGAGLSLSVRLSCMIKSVRKLLATVAVIFSSGRKDLF
jgi:hypothetical protein